MRNCGSRSIDALERNSDRLDKEASRWLAIQLNPATWESATEVDYFLTNAGVEQISPTGVAQSDRQRHWLEVCHRETIMLVGLERGSAAGCTKYETSLDFGVRCLYLCPLAHQFRLVRWSATPIDVFAARRARSGYVWA